MQRRIGTLIRAYEEQGFHRTGTAVDELSAHWLADEIQRRFFDLLDAPVRRVTGGEASPSISKVLERAAIAQKAEVVAALAEIARY